jgi:hypothetical protein
MTMPTTSAIARRPILRRSLLPAAMTAAAVLVALAVVPAATANNPTWVPTRDIIQTQDDVLITDQCAFPVLAHFDGPEIHTTFTDKEGNVLKLLGVFPGHTLTLTNFATGRSITLGATGSFHLELEPDGSGSAMVTGQGAWPGNPVTEEPGIWYQSGRVSTSWDAGGNTTSLESTGTLVDLCPELA